MFNEPVRPNLYVKPSVNDDVEKWLKNKSNEITVLPEGFTNFPDGKLPIARVQVKPLDIEKYNAEKVTKKAPVKANKPKLEKVDSKPKAKKSIGRPKKPTKLYIFTEAEMNRICNRETYANARKLGLTEFQAICSKHGLTDYYFDNNNARCKKCRYRSLTDAEVQANNKRVQLNFELMNLAVELNNKHFTGMCESHGKTKFLIMKNTKTSTGFYYKCITCQNNASYRYKAKKKGVSHA
ncbi:hypothetical protein IC798_05390 [Acinetobacter seifertii]|uniref:hypothetical protein n=1 Tax=Acinetobacter seifertii TaxID=1530123 RepID=UPI00168D6149|nr:hypothetical protein [Acinetobacter seifertii]QNX02770.1 hypothetical protein IC798_05390 [Acinetobacter seifertii]